MSFRRSRAVVPVLEVLPEAASTNDVLQARAGDLPDLAVANSNTNNVSDATANLLRANLRSTRVRREVKPVTS